MITGFSEGKYFKCTGSIQSLWRLEQQVVLDTQPRKCVKGSSNFAEFEGMRIFYWSDLTHWHECDENGNIKKELKMEENKKKSLADLKHEYDTTRGLWCIDRDPREVTYKWILENTFQLGPVNEKTVDDITRYIQLPTSSVISIISYNSINKRLKIELRDGSTITYLDVPENIWEIMVVVEKKGESIRSYLYNQIMDKYDFERIV